ncbi:MAG: hypothetical protein SGPRY_014715 [Prymnesium sp.]
MLEASDYNPKLVAVALGSYVTGSNNFFHQSAVVMVTGKTKEWIPEVEVDKCLNRYRSGVYNVCLPYLLVPQGASNKQSQTASGSCTPSMKLATSIKALLLEVVQAVSGLILSTNFLVSLMKMMESTGCKLVVDEVLTGGRTSGSFLASTTRSIKPHNITLGKWTQCGLVLKRAEIKDDAEEGLTASGKGQTEGTLLQARCCLANGPSWTCASWKPLYLPLLQRAAPTGVKTSTLNGITTSKSRASICYVDEELGDKYKKMQGTYIPQRKWEQRVGT